MNRMKGNERNENEKGMRDDDNRIARVQVDQATKRRASEAAAN